MSLATDDFKYGAQKGVRSFFERNRGARSLGFVGIQKSEPARVHRAHTTADDRLGGPSAVAWAMTAAEASVRDLSLAEFSMRRESCRRSQGERMTLRERRGDGGGGIY